MTTQGWSEKLRTGARAIDSDTECLFFLLDALFKDGRPCGAPGQPCVKMGAVFKFAARRFVREEKLMNAAGYDRIDEHSAAHSALLDKLSRMEERLKCGRCDPAKLRHTLEDWIHSHSEEFDKPLGRFIAAQPGASDAA